MRGVTRKKIAIIGNSGMGKSTILRLTGADLTIADMDCAFPCKESSPYRNALEWMIDETPGQAILAVSVHREMLKRIADAKRCGLDGDYFSKILFVHLWNSDPEKHRQFLEKAVIERKVPKTSRHVEYVLKLREEVYGVCKIFANLTIDMAVTEMNEAAEIVKGLRDTELK